MIDSHVIYLAENTDNGPEKVNYIKTDGVLDTSHIRETGLLSDTLMSIFSDGKNHEVVVFPFRVATMKMAEDIISQDDGDEEDLAAERSLDIEPYEMMAGDPHPEMPAIAMSDKELDEWNEYQEKGEKAGMFIPGFLDEKPSN